MFNKLIQAIEWYDDRFTKPVPCSNDLMCQRYGLRHKNGCIGRTEPLKVYVKGLKAIR